MLAASSIEWREKGLNECQDGHCHPEGWIETCCLGCFPYLSEPDHSGLSPIELKRMLDNPWSSKEDLYQMQDNIIGLIYDHEAEDGDGAPPELIQLSEKVTGHPKFDILQFDLDDIKEVRCYQIKNFTNKEYQKAIYNRANKSRLLVLKFKKILGKDVARSLADIVYKNVYKWFDL